MSNVPILTYNSIPVLDKQFSMTRSELAFSNRKDIFDWIAIASVTSALAVGAFFNPSVAAGLKFFCIRECFHTIPLILGVPTNFPTKNELLPYYSPSENNPPGQPGIITKVFVEFPLGILAEVYLSLIAAIYGACTGINGTPIILENYHAFLKTVSILNTILAGPIAEEILFRGCYQLLFQNFALFLLAERITVEAAAIFGVISSALFFGLEHNTSDPHFYYYRKTSAFIGGFVSGLTMHQFGFTAACTAHIAHNTFASRL